MNDAILWHVCNPVTVGLVYYDTEQASERVSIGVKFQPSVTALFFFLSQPMPSKLASTFSTPFFFSGSWPHAFNSISIHSFNRKIRKIRGAQLRKRPRRPNTQKHPTSGSFSLTTHTHPQPPPSLRSSRRPPEVSPGPPPIPFS